ncbi:YbbR-like domain-containing protein [Rhodohalobacter sp. SW132]|uniref:CdaR family protein n=1 Tax=Rhodohalobacter sp. SW132 TaxID=2293433 RepID=UPI000E266119|nr:YbbR-like domain-containing protein [Rhodohalobacter sp. SW132]REL38532.1 YbbR-like domain-containing protein [Rhodohalobacter sp. SW132]
MGIFKTTKDKITELLTGRWGVDEDDDTKMFSRQKVLGFAFAMLLSISLWVIVNMGRDYNVSMMIPIEIAQIPEDVALSSEIPNHAAVSVSGEGWSLFNLYTNIPTISLSGDNQQVNMFEQVRQQIGSVSTVSVMQVDPMFIEIETEQRITKRVPVESNISLSTRSQFGILGSPRFIPDSVTVTGPASRVEQIESWSTEESTIADVSTNLELNVELESPGSGLTVSPSEVQLRADIAEFTEAQVRIPVRTRDLPSGVAITFSPSSILVRYDVPIEQYNDVQDIRPFVAFVDYERIEADTTGLITPQLETVTDEYDVRLRSFQPTRISYFNILSD